MCSDFSFMYLLFFGLRVLNPSKILLGGTLNRIRFASLLTTFPAHELPLYDSCKDMILNNDVVYFPIPLYEFVSRHLVFRNAYAMETQILLRFGGSTFVQTDPFSSVLPAVVFCLMYSVRLVVIEDATMHLDVCTGVI